MTTPLADVLAAVPSLNDANKPFAYAVEGDTIVGSWDIVKATSLYPTELTSIDKDYRITVTFDVAKGTFDFNEVHTAATGSVDATAPASRRASSPARAPARSSASSSAASTRPTTGSRWIR